MMIHPRDLYSSPPPAQTSKQDNPTLLVSWWCTGFALAIILVRVAGRYVRSEKLFREDKIMFWSIIPLLIRMGLVHVVLLWGTNNAIATGLSPENIRHREIGSRLVLASRIMYAMFLWTAKFTVSEFLKRLTSQVWKRSYEIGLQCIRWFLIVTFVLVVIATLSECQPFPHYWQVVPDPGPKCRQGIAQLIAMGTSDVITDILLVCFPIPIVLKSAMPAKRKVSLVLLFALSLILVGITIYRVIAVTQRHSNQQFRSLVASLEILAAAAVSNALVLGSFVRDRGTKKQRFRFGSTGGTSSLDRATTPRRMLTARNWGSDADLVGDLGISCAPELSEGTSNGPRPAPIALPMASQAKILTPAPVGQDWNFPNRRRSSVETYQTDPNSPTPLIRPTLSPRQSPQAPRSPSFFDVGGLLGDSNHHRPSYSPPPSHKGPRSPSFFDVGGLLERDRLPSHHQQNISIPNFSRPTSAQRGIGSISPPPTTTTTTISQGGPRKGSHALLQDIGGLLSSSSSSSTSENKAKELQPSLMERERRVNLVDVLRESPAQHGGGGGGESRKASAGSGSGGGDGGGGGRSHQRSEMPGLQDVGGLLK